MEKYIRFLSAILILLFGIITLFLSASVIFDLFGVREMEGNYVLFVVWANFISSLLYILASFGFFKTKKWTAIVLGSSFVVLVIALVELFLYIDMNGIYEEKTIGAMIFRIILTFIFTIVAFFTTSKININKKNISQKLFRMVRIS